MTERSEGTSTHSTERSEGTREHSTGRSEGTSTHSTGRSGATASGGAADDYWRRPSGDGPAQTDTGTTGQPTGDVPPVYTGPPRMERPVRSGPAPLIQPLPPPRQLPEQDLDALDAEERQARTVTLGVTILGGVLLLLLVVLVLVRASSASAAG